MSKETVAEFIAKSKALRQQLPIKTAAQDEYRQLDAIRYPRITKIYCVLIPEGYEWKPTTVDVYEGDLVNTERNTIDTTYVLHGHPVGLICYAPNLCRVAEYSPQGNESPIFLKAYKDKWG